MSKQINISEKALSILEPLRKEYGFSYSEAIVFILKTDNSIDTNVEYINGIFKNLEVLKVENSLHEILRLLYIKIYKKEDIKLLCKELIFLSEKGVKKYENI